MSLPDWTSTDLDDVVASGAPVLADLRADWCVQCGPQEQVLERIAPEFEGTVYFGSVDVGAHHEVVDRYGIRGLPSLLIFAGGEQRDTLNGFKRAPLVRQALLRLLNA